MTQRVLGPTGSPRRRRTLLLPLVVAIALGLFYITGAQAVHDFGGLGDGGVFELDNDADDDPTGAGPVNAGDDWATLIGGGPGNALGSADEQTEVPVTDEVNFSNDDTFCGGTKEKDDLAAWKWCNNAASNDKNDIEDGYAAIYTVPNTATGTCPTLADPAALCAGDKILYVGADRFANNGDSGLGFMFLQTGLAGNTCPAPSTGCTFNDNANGDGTGGTPHHVNGDIYVVSQFTGGGQGVTVDFYVWQGGAGGSWQLDTSGVDCDVASANDIACGTVFGDGIRSTNTCADAPWDYVTKFPGDSPCTVNDFAEGTFYEGGVNLTQRNITGCFKTVLVDTSQSQNINESAQDFVMAPFEGCTSGILTTPQTGSAAAGKAATIPAGGIDIPTTASGNTITVHDNADITVTGVDSFGGTVTFSLCGPLALNSTTNCESGGVQIGTPVTVTGSNGTAEVDSASATLTSVGRYCWRAVYSGDSGAGVPGSSDPPDDDTTTITECFKVNPITPTLTTAATCVPADCVLSPTLKLRDTATLTGTASKPGTNGIGPGGTINATDAAEADGQITWRALGPDNCTTVAMSATSRDVTTGDGTYPIVPPQARVEFTPTAIGQYTFVALYTGSSPNTNSVPESACPDLTDTEEVTVVGSATLTTEQKWLPNDSATVDGPTGSILNGTLTFQLYTGDNCGETSGAAVTGQNYPFTITNETAPETRTTNNTTFVVTAANDGDFSWLVTYDGTGLADPDPVCEKSTGLTITD